MAAFGRRVCFAAVLGVWGGAYGYSSAVRSSVIRNAHHGRRLLYSGVSDSEERKKRLVFLGSPGVAAKVLEALVVASRDSGTFDVVACVSQPPAAKGRKKIIQKSETQALAESLEIKTILTPSSARDDAFLSTLQELKPDLCITAAYGQFLPKKFLEIPKYGTWNIHPSLLPRWRGAAPLQRSLEAGDSIVGVTVLQTVLKMDAGPIVRQTERTVREDDVCDTLLDELFLQGTQLLLDALPQLWDNSIQYTSQNDQLATPANKIQSSEARLNLWRLPDSEHDETRSIAQAARDKLRAFTPWPGTWISVQRQNANEEVSRLKIIEARVGAQDDSRRRLDGTLQLTLDSEARALRVPCADGSVLEITKVQPANRKPMDAEAYWNGLRGEPLFLFRDE